MTWGRYSTSAASDTARTYLVTEAGSGTGTCNEHHVGEGRHLQDEAAVMSVGLHGIFLGHSHWRVVGFPRGNDGIWVRLVRQAWEGRSIYSPPLSDNVVHAGIGKRCLGLILYGEELSRRGVEGAPGFVAFVRLPRPASASRYPRTGKEHVRQCEDYSERALPMSCEMRE